MFSRLKFLHEIVLMPLFFLHFSQFLLMIIIFLNNFTSLLDILLTTKKQQQELQTSSQSCFLSKRKFKMTANKKVDFNVVNL